MAKLDALAEKFYKLIHKLTGDTVSDASAVAGMSINEVCDKLQEEIGNGNLDLVDELAELADVALATPSNGQVLTYDSTAGKWKNADASGGGSTGGGYFLTEIDEQDNMTHTVTEIYEAYEDGLVPIVSDGERIYQLAYVVVADEIPTLKFTNAYIADSGAAWGIQTFVLSISDNTDTVTFVQGGGSIGN